MNETVLEGVELYNNSTEFYIPGHLICFFGMSCKFPLAFSNINRVLLTMLNFNNMAHVFFEIS